MSLSLPSRTFPHLGPEDCRLDSTKVGLFRWPQLWDRLLASIYTLSNYSKGEPVDEFENFTTVEPNYIPTASQPYEPASTPNGLATQTIPRI
jgi:hypothetical protein